MNLRRFRPRFTVRRLMILTAVVAISIGVGKTYARWVEYDRQALIHEIVAQLLVTRGGCFLPDSEDPTTPPPEERRRQRSDLVAWHRDMGRKYRKAKQTPWQVAEPDPPKPQ